MTPEKELALEEYLNAISEILYEETDSNDLNDNDLNDIEKIEIAVRDKILSHVSPKIFSFFIEKKTGTNKGRKRTLKSPLGKISITEEQSKYLNIKKSTQLSPLLKKCCLRISANVSYQNTAKDIEYLTGIYVSAKTQQRLVQGTEFKRAEAEDEIKELSVDGGKIRLRTPIGKPCEWRDYKAICLNTEVNAACFPENQTLIDWVNQQSLGNPFTCLGDGHDGIWNIISKFGKIEQRLEILDWFHLK